MSSRNQRILLFEIASELLHTRLNRVYCVIFYLSVVYLLSANKAAYKLNIAVAINYVMIHILIWIFSNEISSIT